MNKTTARKISRSGKITWGELHDTLERAYQHPEIFKQRSVTNKGFTKGVVFNWFMKYFKQHQPGDLITCRWQRNAQHILHDFGDYWQGWMPEPTKKRALPEPKHQEPVFEIEWKPLDTEAKKGYKPSSKYILT